MAEFNLYFAQCRGWNAQGLPTDLAELSVGVKEPTLMTEPLRLDAFRTLTNITMHFGSLWKPDIPDGPPEFPVLSKHKDSESWEELSLSQPSPGQLIRFYIAVPKMEELMLHENIFLLTKEVFESA